MTLIAAIRYDDGIIVCADAQETVCNQFGNQYRKAVQKITPLEAGNYQVIVAGSGHAGLIESFILCLQRTLQIEAFTDLGSFVTSVETQLANFYQTDVALCLDPDDDKRFKLFIGAVSKTTKENNVWVTENIRLRPIGDNELIGCGEPLYVGTMRRLCRPKMTASQAILAGIYVLTIAKETSNYVGGDTSVAVVRGNGIWMEDQDYVRSMEQRLRDYERQINDVFLACANTEVSPEQLDEKLSLFSAQALSLHKAYLNSVVNAMVESRLNTSSGDPYPKVPVGTVISISPQGTVSAAYDEAERQAVLDRQVEVAKRLLRNVREASSGLPDEGAPEERRQD